MVASDDDGGAGSNARIVYTRRRAAPTICRPAASPDSGTGTYGIFAHQDEYRDTVEGNGAAGAINTGASGTASLQVAATTTSGGRR